jgi:hypothetical protein
MQGEYAATAGYHSANDAVSHTEDQMDESTIGELANLATSTAEDRRVVASMTQADARLAKQLEEKSTELRDSRHSSINNTVQSAATAASTRLPTLISGHMVSNLAELTQVSGTKHKKRPQNGGHSRE